MNLPRSLFVAAALIDLCLGLPSWAFHNVKPGRYISERSSQSIEKRYDGFPDNLADRREWETARSLK